MVLQSGLVLIGDPAAIDVVEALAAISEKELGGVEPWKRIFKAVLTPAASLAAPAGVSPGKSVPRIST